MFRVTACLEAHEPDAAESGNGAAEHWTQDGYPRISPVGIALVLYRADGVGNTRSEVTGGIHGVSRSAAKRHAEGHDDISDRHWTERWEAEGVAFRVVNVALRAEGDDKEYQQQRGDELADEVAWIVADGRSRAEHAELGVLVLSGVEVVFIEQPNDDAAKDAANHLADDVCRNGSPWELAGHGETYGNGGIEICLKYINGSPPNHSICKLVILHVSMA